MKLLDRIRAAECVESVSDERGFEGGNVFVNLKPYYAWSEQGSFGCDTLQEAWRMVKQVVKIDTPRIDS